MDGPRQENVLISSCGIPFFIDIISLNLTWADAVLNACTLNQARSIIKNTFIIVISLDIAHVGVNLFPFLCQ